MTINMPQTAELLKPGARGFHPDLKVYYWPPTDTIKIEMEAGIADLFSRKEIEDTDWKYEFAPRVLKFLRESGVRSQYEAP